MKKALLLAALLAATTPAMALAQVAPQPVAHRQSLSQQLSSCASCKPESFRMSVASGASRSSWRLVYLKTRQLRCFGTQARSPFRQKRMNTTSSGNGKTGTTKMTIARKNALKRKRVTSSYPAFSTYLVASDHLL